MLLSICIPTHEGRCEKLAQALESVIAEVDRSQIDVEVCVSDNGSRDRTMDVVESARLRLGSRLSLAACAISRGAGSPERQARSARAPRTGLQVNRLDRSVLLSIYIPTHHGRSEHLRTVSLPVLIMPYPLVGPLRALQAQGLGTRAEDA